MNLLSLLDLKRLVENEVLRLVHRLTPNDFSTDPTSFRLENQIVWMSF